ncbi:hypothetical protein I7I51_02619 [Histoplasma capsulatum]|uniref:Uncharacterized protein n=1 Tax=Ajellomyces capsulatus TaxID=5037 RepID=A0A8A1M8P8_AJECA|nr:hypothetical protein I7I51_02619 [Histoplasma capsulatum]
MGTQDATVHPRARGKDAGDSQDGDATFYEPLPKADFPAFNWDNADFYDWSEGYSAESRRVDYTLQNTVKSLGSLGCHVDVVVKFLVSGLANVGLCPLSWQTCGEFEVAASELLIMQILGTSSSQRGGYHCCIHEMENETARLRSTIHFPDTLPLS